MGKKKQKVRWCLVDGLKWSTQEQEETISEVSTPPSLVQPQQPPPQQLQPQPTDRRNSQGWRENLAPRFERRHQSGHQLHQRQVYYDGEYCDAEELPNGFTKIRSKNLDILFKRDYYEQKIALREKEREQAEHTEEAAHTQEPAPSSQPDTETTPQTMESSAPPVKSISSFRTIDPSEIPEFKPMNQSLEREVGSPPFYPGYPHPSAYPQPADQLSGYGYPPVPPRPNLYLYSPSNNTLIPCEEIIIPNPVMSAEGPVYTGPTNIYLAYPVSGPDGRGYITQPFSPPLPQDYMPYSPYSPSISVDGSSTYLSSTPQTPNSGQESGSSTQPASPPPLADYHPANWFRKEPQTPPFLRKKMGEERQERSTDHDSGSSTTSPTVQYIPGLPVESLLHHQKKAQKKKRKKKPTEPLEHRGSTSSETELPAPLQELHLTDDLADFMVNPPTEPECSDEETLCCSQEGAAGGLPRDPTLTSLDIPADMPLDEVSVVPAMAPPVAADVPALVEEGGSCSVGSPESVESGCDHHEASYERVSLIEETLPDVAPVVEEQSLAPHAEAELVSADVTCNESVADSAAVDVAGLPEGDTSEPVLAAASMPDLSAAVAVAVDTDIEDVKADETVAGGGAEESVDVPTLPAEPAVPAGVPLPPRNKNKPRNRKKLAEPGLTSPAQQESQSTSLLTSHAKSYSAVCRSGAEVPPTPAAPPLHVEEPVAAAAPASQPARGGDQWENVPAALSASPERWQRKKDRKRKGKKAASLESSEEDKSQEELAEPEPLSEAVEEARPPVKEATPAPAAPAQPQQEEEEASLLKDQNPETEGEDSKRSNKVKRRRRKHTSEEPEEGHRVIICDNEVELRLSRVVRRASEVLTSHQLDLVRSSGFCDFLVVEKLGSGINRGSFNLGRLYQGKYVPPDRVDGLLAVRDQEESSDPLADGGPTPDLDLD